MLTYCTVHAVDLFAPQKDHLDEMDKKKTSDNEEQKEEIVFQPPFLMEREFPEYESQLSSTTTTKRPWTLR